ncbi:MAG: GFA family protein [Rhodospirillales bacterium]|nr:GFA family protein [Rhodospirillales bacterium]
MTGAPTPKPVLTGGCQCGAVRYALYAAPEGTHLCHCRMCQKAMGAPFAPLAPVRRTDFAWTRGRPATFRSSTVAVRSFCAGCGTPLAFAYPSSDWIDVTIGSLDEPERAPPGRHYGIENRVAWIDTIPALPCETTEANMDPELQQRLVNFQHPDHDTPDDWTPPSRA